MGIVMPHVPCTYSFPFENISENGSPGLVKITVVHQKKTTPLIQTIIKVPVSELEIL